jgi:nitroreductase
MSCDGATLLLKREEILACARRDLRDFFASRHSIRHFADGPVDLTLIRQAIQMAISTPSVCNRQAWRVYVLPDDDLKERALRRQNGNRGFSEQIAVLLVVACDLRQFVSIGERNQPWIDGGMFAMSLLLALHSLGLGTCCLNWSVDRDADEELREAIGIAECDVVLMMIAVGNLADQFLVARSERRDISKIMIILHGGIAS